MANPPNQVVVNQGQGPQNQGTSSQGWSSTALVNTFIKATGITAAVFLHLSNQNPASDNLASQALTYVKSHHIAFAHMFFITAFVPEFITLGKCCYDNPEVAASLVATAGYASWMLWGNQSLSS